MANGKDQEAQDRAEREALVRKQHQRRLMKAVDSGFTLTGVRLADPADGNAPGVVVTLLPGESKVVVDAIKTVLAARK